MAALAPFTSGPPTYKIIIEASQNPVLPAIRALREYGLTWSTLQVMRGVTAPVLRVAGSGHVRINRSGGGRCSLFAAMSDRARRMELTYALGLYVGFDVNRSKDDVLVEPIAMARAWKAFLAVNPNPRISAPHLWFAARAYIQKTIGLARCTRCALPHLVVSDRLRSATSRHDRHACLVCAEFKKPQHAMQNGALGVLEQRRAKARKRTQMRRARLKEQQAKEEAARLKAVERPRARSVSPAVCVREQVHHGA